MIISDANSSSSSSELLNRLVTPSSSSLSELEVAEWSCQTFGVESSVMSKLPGSSTETWSNYLTSFSVESLCSLCSETIDEELGDLYCIMGCEHIYHNRCISEWKKYSTKCPCCRGPLRDKLDSRFSILQNMPSEEALPDMSPDAILENVIFCPLGIIWPIFIVSLFVLLETACFCLFIVFILFGAFYVIYNEDANSVT